MKRKGNHQELDIQDDDLDVDNSLSNDSSTSLIKFQVLEYAYQKGNIYAFGRKQTGESVCCKIYGFTWYFYWKPPAFINKIDLPDLLLRKANENCRTQLKIQAADSFSFSIPKYHESYFPYMSRYQEEKKFLYSSHQESTTEWIRLEFSLQEFFYPFKDALVQTIQEYCEQQLLPFPKELEFAELDVKPILRFCSDMDIWGCSWLCLDKNKSFLRKEEEEENRKCSTCQEEYWINCNNVVQSSDSDSLGNAPFLKLAFDIECLGTEGDFPVADRDHDVIIQISLVLSKVGEQGIFERHLFSVGECASIADAIVHNFECESSMLITFQQFIQEKDPDILIGHNVELFDFPYIIDRCKHLGIARDALYFGRMLDSRAWKKKVQKFSNQTKGQERMQLAISGRWIADTYTIIREGTVKYRSYTLNMLSNEILGKQKIEIPYSSIEPTWLSGPEGRARIGEYCIWDAELSCLLLDKLALDVDKIEMSRVTGVTLTELTTKGQAVKYFGMFLRNFNKEGYILPTRTRTSKILHGDDNKELKKEEEEEEEESSYEGAMVLSPQVGFYQDPVATLDFMSLYPSIIIGHNLSAETQVTQNQIEENQWKEGIHYERSPVGACFLKSDMKKGIIPKILEKLLANRKRVKALEAAEKDPFLKRVLNLRQNNYKLSANSIYGGTGERQGKVQCYDVSASTTAYGRYMIENDVRNIIDNIPENKNKGIQVIYGDTDSVMILMPGFTVRDSMNYAKNVLLPLINSRFPKPICLDFEKVFFPYLLLSKKRYAGVHWTKPDMYEKINFKGVESVRRDTCRLVSRLVESVGKKILEEPLQKILAFASSSSSSYSEACKQHFSEGVKNARNYVRAEISSLMCGKTSMFLLEISKGLSKCIEGYANQQPHVELAKKMTKRNPLNSPKVGSRIKYVIVNQNHKLHKGPREKALVHEKAEDPLWILQHPEEKIELDIEYYVRQQLQKPLCRIFAPIYQGRRLLDHQVLKDKQLQKSYMDLSYRKLFKPYLRYAKAPTVRPQFGIGKYLVVKKKCLTCQRESTDTALCNFCIAEGKTAQSVKENVVSDIEDLMVVSEAAWKRCVDCAKSKQNAVACVNTDCCFLYERYERESQIASLQRKLSVLK